MRLQELRKEKRLTQQDVADFLTIERTSYARYENGTRVPSADTLVKLADYYQVSVDFLMGRTDDRGKIIDVNNLANKIVQARQAAHDQYKILYDAAQGASIEDIKIAAALLINLKSRDDNNEDIPK